MTRVIIHVTSGWQLLLTNNGLLEMERLKCGFSFQHGREKMDSMIKSSLQTYMSRLTLWSVQNKEYWQLTSHWTRRAEIYRQIHAAFLFWQQKTACVVPKEYRIRTRTKCWNYSVFLEVSNGTHSAQTTTGRTHNAPLSSCAVNKTRKWWNKTMRSWFAKR